MPFTSNFLSVAGIAVLFSTLFLPVTVFGQSHVGLRVMAANLTSGNDQRYEAPGLNILKGLKPDVVAIQEFNYASISGAGINTPAAFREMVNNTFGTNFVYFRESGYSIPNGIISRYPMLASGSWMDSDAGVNDRGFAWAQIDLPGTNDLYVVSVHLKASNSGSDVSRRAAEAAELKALVSTNFPLNAWVIVAGDFNIYSESEAATAEFGSFLSDFPVPADLNGGTNTNQGRSERYDRVLVGFSLTNALVPVAMTSHTLPNGLVFVSTNYTPLSDVSPVQIGDTTVAGMQHMAVVKDFRITLPVTAPTLSMPIAGVIRWQGASNLTYNVQVKTNLASPDWMALGGVTSSSTNYAFTNSSKDFDQKFYRVTYP